MIKRKKKWQRLAAAITLGMMTNASFFSYISLTNVYAGEEQGEESQTSSSNEEQSSSSGDNSNQTSSNSDSGNNSSDKQTTQDKVAQIAKVMGASGAAPVIGANAKVDYQVMVDGDYKPSVYPVCTGTSAPSQNEKATYNCAIVGTKAYGVAIPISGTVSGGKQTLSGYAPFTYLAPNPPDKNGKVRWSRRAGVVVLGININGYQGKTSMSNGPKPFYDGPTGLGFCTGTECSWTGPACTGDACNGVFGPSDPDPDDDDPPKGGSLCPDGTYICTDPTDPKTLFPGGGTKGGTEDPFGTGSGGNGTNWDDINGGNGYPGVDGGTDGGVWGGNGYPGGDSGTTGLPSTDDGHQYGSALDKLLGENGKGYNSGDANWANSSGGDSGSSNLDDYFDGLSDSSGDENADGITDDLLGVDENLLNGSGDGTDDFDSAGDVTGETEEDADSEGDGAWGVDESDADGSFFDRAETLGEGGLSSLQDLMNAVDGISGDDSNGGGSSLASSISQFLKGIADPEKGVAVANVSEQDLFETAKKLLMANGMTLDDIINGKGYDKGSAYTEPKQAWDMNRITTLLKSGKVKPHADDVATTEKNSITKASNNSKAINATKSSK